DNDERPREQWTKWTWFLTIWVVDNDERPRGQWTKWTVVLTIWVVDNDERASRTTLCSNAPVVLLLPRPLRTRKWKRRSLDLDCPPLLYIDSREPSGPNSLCLKNDKHKKKLQAKKHGKHKKDKKQKKKHKRHKHKGKQKKSGRKEESSDSSSEGSDGNGQEEGGGVSTEELLRRLKSIRGKNMR
ncbi:unnamed protein product, partial [Coregonus sp. 'balchen']